MARIVWSRCAREREERIPATSNQGSHGDGGELQGRREGWHRPIIFSCNLVGAAAKVSWKAMRKADGGTR